MKISLGRIVGGVAILDKVNVQNPTFKVGYWVMRNMKILADSYNFFISKREEIYNKYCDVVNGAYFILEENGMVKFNLKQDVKVEDFYREMNELLNVDCGDIQPYVLSLDVINDMSEIKLNGNDIHAIDYLLPE